MIKRIEELCKKQKMSRYRLAQKSGLSQSSISNLLNRKSLPSIITLNRICNGFGITLSQFFTEEGNVVNLSKEQQCVLDTWSELDEEERKLVDAYIKGLKRR